MILKQDVKELYEAFESWSDRDREDVFWDAIRAVPREGAIPSGRLPAS